MSSNKCKDCCKKSYASLGILRHRLIGHQTVLKQYADLMRKLSISIEEDITEINQIVEDLEEKENAKVYKPKRNSGSV